MSEDTNQPGIKNAIDEQARLIVSLQKQLKAAINVGIAEDVAYFAQAVLAATQTWKTLVDTWEEVKPKPATSITQTVHPASVYQTDPTRRGSP